MRPEIRRRRLATVLAAALTVALTGLGTAAAATAPVATAAPDSVTIDILATNDFHGRLEANGQEAGAAAMATAVKQMRQANPNTIFAAAGDLVGASTFTSFIQRDEPTIHALNAAGLEVSAVGNHELDQGYDDLMKRVIPLASWKYIAANIPVKQQMKGRYDDIAESWTKEVDGVKVGFVGAVTEHLPELVSPSGIAMLDVVSITQAANAAADRLKAEGADIIVLLVHEGAANTSYASATDPNTDFGKIVNGVNGKFDAIVSGHTHLSYNHHVPVPQWTNENRAVTDRPVVSAGQYGYNLNKITFTFDKTTRTTVGMNSTIVPLTKNEGGVWLPLYTPDPTVAQIVKDAVDFAKVAGEKPLGKITADFNRAFNANGTTENRGGESTLGNLVADAQLAAAQATVPSAQIAFMNPGGLRTDMKYGADGTITYRQAANVQPFANTLFTTLLTGEQIVQVLEEQWQPEGASRPFLKLGVSEGFFYTYDPTAPKGQHITSVSLHGEPLTMTGEYRVVANSFLAAGGDNFFTLAKGKEASDTGQIDLESMVTYFAKNSPLSPDYRQRAVGVQLATPAAGFQAGETVTVNLSSLLFSASEPKDATVRATFNGEDVGTFPVDPSMDITTDTIDEVGRATVSFQVPASAAPAGGAAVIRGLAITGSTTGTSFTVPVPVGPAACSTTIKGRHNGSLTISGGVACLDSAVVTGSVKVAAGTLRATNSTVNGGVTAVNAGGVYIVGGSVNGGLSITGTTGTVTLSDVTVNGGLSCSGNATPPTDNGQPNRVNGSKSGQCVRL